jgi:hypothetical protein
MDVSEIEIRAAPNGFCVATTPNALRVSARIRLALGYSNWPKLTDFMS